MTDTTSAVAVNVRVLLAVHRMTQTALAQVVGIPQSAVSKRLRGTTPWRLDELDAVASHFGCTVADLLTERAA